MKALRRATTLNLLLTSMVLGCVPRDGAGANNNNRVDPEKPSWWPQPAPQDGLPWPPPRPSDWNAELPWPPPREVTEDVGWWIKRYGEHVDPQRDERLKASNQTGSGGFTRNFRQIFDGDDKAVPGCGLFMLQLLDTRAVPSCDPFPEAVARQTCVRPFTEAIARERCRVLCQRNEKDCRRDDLFVPPIHAGWSCVPPSATDGALVNCDAYYLCNCWED